MGIPKLPKSLFSFLELILPSVVSSQLVVLDSSQNGDHRSGFWFLITGNSNKDSYQGYKMAVGQHKYPFMSKTHSHQMWFLESVLNKFSIHPGGFGQNVIIQIHYRSLFRSDDSPHFYFIFLGLWNDWLIRREFIFHSHSYQKYFAIHKENSFWERIYQKLLFSFCCIVPKFNTQHCFLDSYIPFWWQTNPRWHNWRIQWFEHFQMFKVNNNHLRKIYLSTF